MSRAHASGARRHELPPGARRLGGALAVALALAAAALAATVRVPRGTPGPTLPAEPIRTLAAGAVSYALPAAWTLQGFAGGRAAAEGVAAEIPCPPLDPTPHSANVNLLAEPNGDAEGLLAWSVRRLATGAPRRVVEERVEEGWRTVVSSGEDQGARYVIVERFGATPRARVHAVAAFPALPELGERWFAQAGEDIDRFLHGLALEGAPPSAIHVGWDGAAGRLAICERAASTNAARPGR